MMNETILRSELPALRFDHLDSLEREVIEGRGHTGLAAVVQAIAVRDRGRFAISSNRSSAIHKVSYVETGGGQASEDCTLCQPTVPPKQNDT